MFTAESQPIASFLDGVATRLTDGAHSDGAHSDGAHSDGAHSDGAHSDGAQSVVLAVPGDALVVPEGTLLLTADFVRAGADLQLIGPDGARVLIKGYFGLADPPPLATEGGAVLGAELVARLAGPLAPGQYAQLAAGSDADPVGSVTESAGAVTAIRADGTEVTLSAGAPVFQGDVLITTSNGGVSLLFIDDTTFSLGGNARMIIDELVYDPVSGEGLSALAVIQGVFVFVAGEIAANNPDGMIVTTPSGTIGIRGTTVAGRAAAEGEITTVVLLPDADGSVGVIYVLTSELVVLTLPYQAVQLTSASLPPTIIELTVSQAESLFGDALRFLPQYDHLSPSNDEDRGEDDAGDEADEEGEEGAAAEETEEGAAGEESEEDASGEEGEVGDEDVGGEAAGDDGTTGDSSSDDGGSDDVSKDAEIRGVANVGGTLDVSDAVVIGDVSDDGGTLDTSDVVSSGDVSKDSGILDASDVVSIGDASDDGGTLDVSDVVGIGDVSDDGGSLDASDVVGFGDVSDDGESLDAADIDGVGEVITVTGDFFGDGLDVDTTTGTDGDDDGGVSGADGGVTIRNDDDRDTVAVLGDTSDATDDIVGTSRSDNLRGTDGDDNIFGLGGDDTIDGLAGDDTIDGGDGDDVIQGSSGDDIIIGGAGSDVILGDAGFGDEGVDTFVYNSPDGGGLVSDNVTMTVAGVSGDTINDFFGALSGGGADGFEFDGTGFDLSTGGLTDGVNFDEITGEYDGTNASLGAGKGFVYDTVDNVLYYDPDTGSDGYTVIADLSGQALDIGDITIV